MSAPPPMHSYIETWVPLCGTVCVLQSFHSWSRTLFRMCMCISICTYVNLSPEFCSAPDTVTWKHGFLCVTQYVCFSQSTYVPTPCLEWLCASVHVCISTQLPMVAQAPMDSYMETWVPLCGTLCVSQSPSFWSHTLIKMCTCITTCLHVNLTYHVCFTPFE